MPLPFISSIIPVFITLGQVLWYGFLALAAFFGAYSLILVFHWFRYGMNFIISILATALYLGVAGSLFMIMFFSISSFIVG